jgi:hypothetical protein
MYVRLICRREGAVNLLICLEEDSERIIFIRMLGCSGTRKCDALPFSKRTILEICSLKAVPHPIENENDILSSLL